MAPPLKFERAFERRNPVGCEMKISDRGLDVGMAEQTLEHEDISALIKLMGGKTMAQGMDAAAFGQAGFFFAAS